MKTIKHLLSKIAQKFSKKKPVNIGTVLLIFNLVYIV